MIYNIIPIYFDLEKGFDKLLEKVNDYGKREFSIASTTYIAEGNILIFLQRETNKESLPDED